MIKTDFKYGTLYNTDCIQFLKELPDNSIDFIQTDPPYFENIGKGVIKEGQSRVNYNITKSLNFVSDIDTIIKPSDWFKDALRVLKKVNMIIWLDDRHQLLDYLKLIDEFNLSFYQLIWHKPQSTPFKNIYLKDKEIALYIYEKSPIDCLENDFNSRRTITTWNTKSSSCIPGEYSDFHPTPKPLTIIKNQILKHTKEGDVVLDLFSGSGTTGVACELLKRKWIACELSSEFYKKSIERIQKQGGQEIFEFEWEEE